MCSRVREYLPEGRPSKEEAAVRTGAPAQDLGVAQIDELHLDAGERLLPLVKDVPVDILCVRRENRQPRQQEDCSYRTTLKGVMHSSFSLCQLLPESVLEPAGVLPKPGQQGCAGKVALPRIQGISACEKQ